MYRSVAPAMIPAALTDRPQWVGWTEEHRDGKPTKVPVSADAPGYASVADESTWTAFDTAYQSYQTDDEIAGIGYVFTEDDPFVGVDLDDCRTPATGELTVWAQDIMQTLDSYTETSPSGSGVHVITRVTLLDGRNRHDDIELYAQDRYFTMTGAHLSLTPRTANERTDELAAVHAEYLAADNNDDSGAAPPPEDVESADLTDDEII